MSDMQFDNPPAASAKNKSHNPASAQEKLKKKQRLTMEAFSNLALLSNLAEGEQKNKNTFK